MRLCAPTQPPQFSVLQATSRINQLVEAAAADGMPAVATLITETLRELTLY